MTNFSANAGAAGDGGGHSFTISRCNTYDRHKNKIPFDEICVAF